MFGGSSSTHSYEVNRVPQDDDSEPEAEAAGDGFKNIMIGSVVAAVVLLQALAVIVYAVYKMRNSRQIIVYDLFEQPQFFGERPRDRWLPCQYYSPMKRICSLPEPQ
jgi:hypothetical protein